MYNISTFIVKVKSLSCVRLFATPWTIAYQAPPSMGFSRQEYWRGLPFLSPGKRKPRFDPLVRKLLWRRKWQPSPVFLPGESQEQRSLVGYGSWGCKESDMTNQLSTHASTQKLSSILLQHCLIQGCGSAPEGLPLMSEDT